MKKVKITFKSSNLNFFTQSIYIFISLLKTYTKSYQIFLLPTKKNMISILNSPHVHRSSQKQFYITFYKAIIICKFDKSLNIQNYLFLSLINLGVFFNIKIIL